MKRILLGMIGGLFITGCAMAQTSGGDTATKEYDSGAVYQGQFKDGKQHGTGTYRLPNGYVYEGAWVDGEILGQGRAVVIEL